MTTTQEHPDVVDAENQEQTEEAPKPTKVIKQPQPCYCRTYEVADKEDPDSVFSTGCSGETKSMFAQGHDARLVSFLVDGHFDGYVIRQVLPDGDKTRTVVHDTPADAVAHISEALAEKANKATLNRRAKIAGAAERQAAREALKAQRAEAKAKARAEKEAAKAAAKEAGPKATGAEVVAGSKSGDLPELPEGHARIKVGKFEYVAAIDDEGNATYVDGAGDKQTINRDGYRLLTV